LSLPLIADELTSVLPFHGQHAFALGTAIALAKRSRPASQVQDCWAGSWQVVVAQLAERGSGVFGNGQDD
jgi:hypothetical protein